ncbi:non-ribosomal peptide synthetase, partial [Burkholderia stagnalis]
SEAERDDALRGLLRELSLKPFDLVSGPLLRVTLIRCGADSHVLHFAMHHIVSDAWSLEVLTQEFAQAYESYCRGATPVPAPLPIQYGDYALWQREWLDEAAIESQLAYWRGRLGTEHPVLELPTSRKRTGLRGAAGGRVRVRLPVELSSALRRLSQRHGATLFMTLLAAYDVLLSKYSGQKDIRIGVPTAGRDRLETEGLIGFFVNTLVIRTELSGVKDFGELLKQVNDRVVEAQAHQDLPFARLVDALQPARSLSHTPLFQAMFNYAGAERGEFKLPGLTIAGLSDESETARFDLVLNVADGESIAMSLGYARDVFDEAVVERMLGHYVEILEQVAAQEAKPLGSIALGVKGSWQAEPVESGFEPVVRRIAARAVERPEAEAVHCEGERLSYGELDGWSNRIGRRLASLGVMGDERIGICMRRSAGVIASLLGVLKSGAAFVPLDPEYPADRLAYMMEDAGVRRVIADAETAGRLSSLLTGKDVIDAEGVGEESDAAFEVEVQPDQLAYVIYTSGSTGRPKGVAISHRSLGLHLNDFIVTYGITEKDRQLQSSTINFDVALHEMLPALMQGGQVEMRGAQLWDLETTSRHLSEEGVTFSRIPTAYWQQWLREPPSREKLKALRQITVGGEGLPGDALRQWRAGPLSGIRL